MKFSSENMQRFLNDEPFFDSLDCYCLGKSFEDAADILRLIILEKEIQDVELDNERTLQRLQDGRCL